MSFEEKHVRNDPVFFCMPSLYRGRDCKNIWLKWRIRIVKSAANILFCIFLLLLYFILGRGRKRWCFLLDGSLENHLPHVCMSLCNETVQGKDLGDLEFKLESSDCNKWQDSSVREGGKQKSECRRDWAKKEKKYLITQPQETNTF